MNDAVRSLKISFTVDHVSQHRPLFAVHFTVDEAVRLKFVGNLCCTNKNLQNDKPKQQQIKMHTRKRIMHGHQSLAELNCASR